MILLIPIYTPPARYALLFIYNTLHEVKIFGSLQSSDLILIVRQLKSFCVNIQVSRDFMLAYKHIAQTAILQVHVILCQLYDALDQQLNAQASIQIYNLRSHYFFFIGFIRFISSYLNHLEMIGLEDLTSFGGLTDFGNIIALVTFQQGGTCLTQKAVLSKYVPTYLLNTAFSGRCFSIRLNCVQIRFCFSSNLFGSNWSNILCCQISYFFKSSFFIGLVRCECICQMLCKHLSSLFVVSRSLHLCAPFRKTAYHI